VDVMSPMQRSLCMSRIKGFNTGPEIILRRAVWNRGFRYKLKYPLLGKPDIVFVSARIAVFVDGCFWHGCPKHAAMPNTNRTFWKAKLRKNIERDRSVTAGLRRDGWRVLRFWEHDIECRLDWIVVRILKMVRARSATRRVGCPS